MKQVVANHHVVLSFDRFGNFNNISVHTNFGAAVALNSNEQANLQADYANIIAAEQGSQRQSLKETKPTFKDRPLLEKKYTLVLSKANPLLTKFKQAQDIPAPIGKAHGNGHRVASNARAVNLLEDMPRALQNHFSQYLSFADGSGLLLASTETRKIVTRRDSKLVRPAEFALAMDITASMGSYLQQAKLLLGQVINTLSESMTQRGFYQRSAWLGYRDLNDREPFHIKDFTTNASTIDKYLQKARAEGGGDVPEDVAGALDLLIHELSWTKNKYARGLKNIILVLDAPPHGMGYAGDDFPNGTPNKDWLELAQLMAKLGLVVNPVLCVRDCPELDLFATTIAEITGGKCVRLQDADLLAQYIVASINRDLDLQQAIETELQALLVTKPELAEPEQLTAEVLNEQVHQIVGRLSSNPSYEVANLCGEDVPGQPLTFKMAKCNSEPEARTRGLLPKTKPVKLKPARKKVHFHFSCEEKSERRPTCGEDLPALPGLPALMRSYTSGGSLHLRRASTVDSNSSRLSPTLASIAEDDDGEFLESIAAGLGPVPLSREAHYVAPRPVVELPIPSLQPIRSQLSESVNAEELENKTRAVMKRFRTM